MPSTSLSSAGKIGAKNEARRTLNDNMLESVLKSYETLAEKRAAPAENKNRRAAVSSTDEDDDDDVRRDIRVYDYAKKSVEKPRESGGPLSRGSPPDKRASYDARVRLCVCVECLCVYGIQKNTCMCMMICLRVCVCMYIVVYLYIYVSVIKRKRMHVYIHTYKGIIQNPSRTHT